ncbi:nuclear transport factor 2 family protein [Streptantibioticus ferralitis]|uniref:Nuclear transport factor 2 family protein n=1 Tax=Streptantibioticus ferralitis TaxID=236510 RepID=A0ABT5YVG0_9ACTN|nr:nuclear transport factor 2 family protein [Streptantibioticus ferralitis]MDF2255539.1 nuclear transport factor 2 family protein [Streptantibioticus ferralitis]
MSADDVTQLVLGERQSRDRGRYDQTAECFAEESVVEMSWFQGSGADFVRETRGMAGRGDHAVHRLGPPTVHVLGDRALAELPLIIEWRVDISGVAADLATSCRSQYRAQRGADDVWRIVRITSIYEKDTLTPALPHTRLDIDPLELTAYRPSYRCLAWYMNRNGYRIGPNHLGDDQPEAVARQYQAEMTWLHESRTPAATANVRREQQS